MVPSVLKHLDRSYGVNDTDQLDLDLDYSRDTKATVGSVMAGFHARIDKFSELNLNAKLQGHLLLQQARLILDSAKLGSI